MIAHNPYNYLQQQGIAITLLDETARKSLAMFDRATGFTQRHPGEKRFEEEADKAGALTIRKLEPQVARLKATLKNEAEEAEEKTFKKAQSKKVIQNSRKVLDDLSECRRMIREERQRKIESGEIKKPQKKTLTTKLRNELVKMAGLIPKQLKEDQAVIKRTQKALFTFLAELKSIWGLNKIKPIEDDLKAKFDQLVQRAED